MHTKRVIPCLDVKDGRVVKGVNFVNFRDAGDPSEVAVYFPNPSTARLKIPPHMIEVQRPTNTKYIALIGTSAKPNDKPPVALC